MEVPEEASGDEHQSVERRVRLPEREHAWVIEEWNRTEAPYPADRCIHQLFEAQAEATPHAVAVVHEEEALTYRELNERANRLAHHLARLGARP
ncbi:MAG TPA: AMP-binding protein, partial [Longimicrobium sp.]|nr:AMP-binding protein [Longimicrobium sp.]